MTEHPSGLLVSVRSAAEAISAFNGGASVIDVKEPDRGPLGMADFEIWQEVRAVVPPGIPMSVALGEVSEWRDRPAPPRSVFKGIGFRKIGLAGSGEHGIEAWAKLRDRLGDGPPWIAVIYADWVAANSPDPQTILIEARAAGCPGVLIDTWNKSSAARIDLSWRSCIERIKSEVGIVALAGGLDVGDIERLRVLKPHLFAVRGAACRNGDRRQAIEAGRVLRLVDACGVSAVGHEA
jgi:uncharacterized protein (UPF0264 family)